MPSQKCRLIARQVSRVLRQRERERERGGEWRGRGQGKSTTSRNIQDVSGKLEKCSSKPEAAKVYTRVRPSFLFVTSSRCIPFFSFKTILVYFHERKSLSSIKAKRLQGEQRLLQNFRRGRNVYPSSTRVGKARVYRRWTNVI